MLATKKNFEDIKERLEELYAKVDCLISDNEDVFLIKTNISSANSVGAEMERLALKETNKERKKFLEDALKQYHVFRSAFKERVSVYLSGTISKNFRSPKLSGICIILIFQPLRIRLDQKDQTIIQFLHNIESTRS